MMRNMRKHRKRVEDDETGTDEDSITSDGACVYCYEHIA